MSLFFAWFFTIFFNIFFQEPRDMESLEHNFSTFSKVYFKQLGWGSFFYSGVHRQDLWSGLAFIKDATQFTLPKANLSKQKYQKWHFYVCWALFLTLSFFIRLKEYTLDKFTVTLNQMNQRIVDFMP